MPYGTSDFCHSQPKPVNAISDIKSESGGRPAIEGKLQPTANCKRWIRCRDQIFRLLPPVWPFAFSFWTSLSKHLNIWTIYLNICIFRLPVYTICTFKVPVCVQCTLCMQCSHWQICVRIICIYIIFCGISFAFGLANTNASMVFVNDKFLNELPLSKWKGNLYICILGDACWVGKPKFGTVPRFICHCLKHHSTSSAKLVSEI